LSVVDQLLRLATVSLLVGCHGGTPYERLADDVETWALRAEADTIYYVSGRGRSTSEIRALRDGTPAVIWSGSERPSRNLAMLRDVLVFTTMTRALEPQPALWLVPDDGGAPVTLPDPLSLPISDTDTFVSGDHAYAADGFGIHRIDGAGVVEAVFERSAPSLRAFTILGDELIANTVTEGLLVMGLDGSNSRPLYTDRTGARICSVGTVLYVSTNPGFARLADGALEPVDPALTMNTPCVPDGDDFFVGAVRVSADGSLGENAIVHVSGGGAISEVVGLGDVIPRRIARIGDSLVFTAERADSPTFLARVDL